MSVRIWRGTPRLVDVIKQHFFASITTFCCLVQLFSPPIGISRGKPDAFFLFVKLVSDAKSTEVVKICCFWEKWQ